MKKNKINIKTIIIIVLICTNISFLLIMLNMKNKNIEEQEIVKEQLGETTTDSSYIALSTHISELENKQQEINNMQNTAGQATVTADKILKDYTAYKNGQLITGTMVNNGAVTKTLNAGGSYTIPVGYHNGNGKVTTNSLASQTSATATADNISKGKTAWVNGKLVTGNGSDATPTVSFFNNGATYTAIGSSQTINLTSYSGYKNLVLDKNLFLVLANGAAIVSHYDYDRTSVASNLGYTYDASSGILTYGVKLNNNQLNMNYYNSVQFKVLIVD